MDIGSTGKWSHPFLKSTNSFKSNLFIHSVHKLRLKEGMKTPLRWLQNSHVHKIDFSR